MNVTVYNISNEPIKVRSDSETILPGKTSVCKKHRIRSFGYIKPGLIIVDVPTLLSLQKDRDGTCLDRLQKINEVGKYKKVKFRYIKYANCGCEVIINLERDEITPSEFCQHDNVKNPIEIDKTYMDYQGEIEAVEEKVDIISPENSENAELDDVNVSHKDDEIIPENDELKVESEIDNEVKELSEEIIEKIPEEPIIKKIPEEPIIEKIPEELRTINKKNTPKKKIIKKKAAKKAK